MQTHSASPTLQIYSDQAFQCTLSRHVNEYIYTYKGHCVIFKDSIQDADLAFFIIHDMRMKMQPNEAVKLQTNFMQITQKSYALKDLYEDFITDITDILKILRHIKYTTST